MKSKTGKAEIHSVALNHHLPDKIVIEIIEAVFKMTHEIIEKGNRDTQEFPTIALINFGRFFVTNRKKEFIRDILNEKKRLKDERKKK